MTQSLSYILEMHPAVMRHCRPLPGSGRFGRTSLFCLCLGFISVPSAYSQEWTVQYPPLAVALEDFTSVSAVSADTAFIVGSAGVILKTVNGGASWVRQISGTTHMLHSVSAVDGNTAFAGGSDGQSLGGGVLLQTRDGGNTWEKVETPAPIYSVSAFDRNVAFAVGGIGYVFMTKNGGVDWNGGYLGVNRRLNSVTAIDATVAYAAGDAGTILKTADGGIVWQGQESGSQYTLWSISAVDRNIAYSVGAWDPAFQGGTVLKTTDGGARWSPQSGASSEDLACVSAVDANVAYAVGIGGAIMRTRDGGDNWVFQISGLRETLRGVSALPVGVAFAAGYTASILKTNFSASIPPKAPAKAMAARMVGGRVWFSLKDPEVVTIRALDPGGRVRILEKGRRHDRGEHSLQMPALPAGARWLELTAGESRRLLPVISGEGL